MAASRQHVVQQAHTLPRRVALKESLRNPALSLERAGLLLPGALLVAMRAQLLAALMLINLGFPTLFQ